MNHLKNALSPYLRQHAHQPVHWQEYGEAAFAQAKAEDKPLFISIGYATCHWCHVMAHESFEDETVADLLNTYFIPVKVDRETHPEVDRFYMDACQMMTGQGGWPLSVFTDETGLPFFAATYLPKETKWQQLGLLELLPRIQRLWQEKRTDLQQVGKEIEGYMQQELQGTSHIDDAHLKKVRQQLLQEVDAENGGFGHAPKFPVPQRLSFLLQRAVLKKDTAAEKALISALDAMAKGGLYDHVGGGFFRYATDAAWRLPHFEKMLDDNALLARLYLEAAHHLKAPRFLAVADATMDFLNREMQSPEGLYYAALDADTEEGEGAYYLWKKEELQTLLAEPAPADFFARFGLEAPLLDDGHHLHQVQKGAYKAPENADKAALGVLFEARKKRTLPFVDDKCLLGRNALMLSLWAVKARLFADTAALEKAKKLAETIEQVFTVDTGYALSFYQGKTFAQATLSDLSALLIAYLDLYDATLTAEYLVKAEALVQHIATYYSDGEGTYFETHQDDVSLPVRKERLFDGADRSGASRLLEGLLRLDQLLANEPIRALAQTYMQHLQKRPELENVIYIGFWQSFFWWLQNPVTYLCHDAQALLKTDALKLLQKKGIGLLTVLYVQPKNRQLLAKLTPFLANIPPNETAVRLCENGACHLPQPHFGDAHD